MLKNCAKNKEEQFQVAIDRLFIDPYQRISA